MKPVASTTTQPMIRDYDFLPLLYIKIPFRCSPVLFVAVSAALLAHIRDARWLCRSQKAKWKSSMNPSLRRSSSCDRCRHGVPCPWFDFQDLYRFFCGTPDRECRIRGFADDTQHQIHFYWFHLAKSVARYVNHDLQQDFMRSFNGPRYHCFNVETTTIAVDLMEGRTCFGRHSEVALNTYLAGKEVDNHGTIIIEKC